MVAVDEYGQDVVLRLPAWQRWLFTIACIGLPIGAWLYAYDWILAAANAFGQTFQLAILLFVWPAALGYLAYRLIPRLQAGGYSQWLRLKPLDAYGRWLALGLGLVLLMGAMSVTRAGAYKSHNCWLINLHSESAVRIWECTPGGSSPPEEQNGPSENDDGNYCHQTTSSSRGTIWRCESG